MQWIESTPEPPTYGVPEFASTMDAFNVSSGELQITDGCYLGSMDSHEHQSQASLTCVRARISEIPLHREKRRLGKLAYTDELRKQEKAMASLLVCKPVGISI